MRDGVVIKDLTNIGVDQVDVQVRKDVNLIDHNWKKQ